MSPTVAILGLSSLRFLDNDAAAANGLRTRAVDVVTRAQYVVIHDRAGRLVPDFDAELINASTAGDLAICGREQETVVSRAVHGAATFVLGKRTRNDEPIVGSAVEFEIGYMELELGFTRWHVFALLILRHEAE